MKMKSQRLRATAIALLASLLVVLPAFAVMVIVTVTPGNLDQGTYLFSVATNAVPDGVAVRIGVHLKSKDGMPPAVDTNAGLAVKSGGNGNIGFGGKLPDGRPLPKVTVTRRDHDMEVSFVAGNELLQNTNLYFTFSAVGIRSGQVIMPGGWIYELKLHDFLRSN